MSYMMGKKLEYIAVPEIQEKRKQKYGKAVWHFHMLTMNQPYYAKNVIQEVWGNGYTDPKKVNRVIGTTNYLTKYLSKAYGDKQLKNRKRYYNALSHQTVSHKDPHTISLLLPHIFESTNMVDQYPLTIKDEHGNPTEVGRKSEFISI